MNYRAYISSDPRICGGKPCVKGHRIPIYLIFGYLEAGYSIDGIVTQCYPQLTRKAVRAAVSYASDLFKNLHYHAFKNSRYHALVRT